MKKFFFIMASLLPIIVSFKNDQNIQQNSQWRGQGRDGVYNETGLLKAWPESGPQLLWKYEGLGQGFTSVSIANGKIYITGLNIDKLVLFVFDLKGQLLVKKEVTDEWGEAAQYPGPRSTVCVNDGKLYIYTALGEILCLDETSLDKVWSESLFTGYDGKNIEWGVNESPLIVGEKVFLTPGGAKNNIIALNKNTGALIWSSPGEGTLSSYCSPQYIGDQSIPMIVTSTSDYIIALNADTGEKLWSFPQTNEYNIHPNTPLYHNGMILSATGYRQGAVMLRLKDGGKGVEKVWENPEMDTQLGGVVKIGNYIYATGHGNRFWFCVEWNTGETKYKVRDLAPCNVIFADGMLYCYSEKGEMGLVKPDAEKFDMTGNFKITLGTDQHWAHTVIHEGVLYIRHGDTLMAYNVKY